MRTQRCGAAFLERAPTAAVIALATMTAPRGAGAEEIDALVAAGRSLEALPIALQRARGAPSDAGGWARVLQLAQWNSRDAEALEALRALASIEPDEARWRFELARRLLWRRAFAEASPHARWLAERSGDPSALEVAYWVLRGVEDTDASLAVALRRVVVAPGDARARWALADLTHWSPRWREARTQYEALTSVPEEAPRARERAELLRRDHPTEVGVEGTGWCDSVGVQYVAAAAVGGVQLPARFVLRARAELGRWSQDDACAFIARVRAAAPPGQPAELAVGSLQTTLRYEATSALQPELTVGVEADGSGNVAPIAQLGVRLSLWGRVFGRAWVQHDRYRASLASAHQDVRAMGPAITLYAEPTRWLFAGAEASLWWLDDGNVRLRGLAAVGVHNVGAWQVEPRAFVVVERFERPQPTATPYFTPTDPLTWGGDLTLRYTRPQRLRAELSCGVLVQGGEVALRPGLLVRGELGRHLRLGLTAGYVGSPQYQQVRSDLTVSWVF